MTKPRILLDLDEVLCDFTAGACAAHGVTVAQLNRHRRDGVWDIGLPMAIASTGWGLGGRERLTAEDFWNPINARGPEFWMKLNALPWFDAVINLVSEYSDDWYIITSPSQSAYSHLGKVLWIQQHFGATFDRCVITPHKHLFAHSGTILIDDREENCRKFVEHGGLSLTFPSLGNRFHKSAADPVPFLRACLLVLLEGMKSCT